MRSTLHYWDSANSKGDWGLGQAAIQCSMYGPGGRGEEGRDGRKAEKESWRRREEDSILIVNL